MYWNYPYVRNKVYTRVKDCWTIKEIVESTVEMSNKTYLIDAVTGTHYSYEESNEIANRIANGLTGLGIKKGERIGLFMNNRPEYIFCLFAIGKSGFIEVPINSNLRERELAYIINNAEISTMIVEGREDFVKRIKNVINETNFLKHIIITQNQKIRGNILHNSSKVKLHFLDELMNTSSGDNPGTQITPTDDFCIFYTSGTTGFPKGAPITNKTFVLAALSIGTAPIDKHSRNYTCLPLSHANAQLYSAFAMRCLGGTLILSDHFSVKKFWEEINTYQATYFNSIGGMMQILDAAFTSENVPEHSAQFVVVGGTPQSLWKRFEEKFKIDVIELYSMSECPVLFGNIHPDKKERRIGSFGKPVFPDLGRQVKVIDDNGKEVKVGIGELLQKGEDFITRGYWEAPKANKESFDDDGWFHSGDIVRIDADGFFYYVDRKKFMIRVAGENVSAYEVEEIVNSYPGVALSAAVPVPDPLRDEEIKVFILLKNENSSLNMEDLLRYCAKNLAYFKLPRYIEVIHDFPKTATERIQKNELKSMEKSKKDHGWDRNIEIPDWRQRYYGR